MLCLSNYMLYPRLVDFGPGHYLSDCFIDILRGVPFHRYHKTCSGQMTAHLSLLYPADLFPLERKMLGIMRCVSWGIRIGNICDIRTPVKAKCTKAKGTTKPKHTILYNSSVHNNQRESSQVLWCALLPKLLQLGQHASHLFLCPCGRHHASEYSTD